MKRVLLAVTASAVFAGPMSAQRAEPPTPLAAGAEAPDFTLVSADQMGTGELVSLRDFRGQVVVIAFFYRARTSG